MSAVISESGKYRYLLRRDLGSILRWHKPMLFIMLNPSTADAELDDPTIRRCKFFAEREGATQLVVANLFAFRTPHPSKLHIAAKDWNITGPENDEYLSIAIKECSSMPIVAAWGANKIAKRRLMDDFSYYNFHCLGTTKDGSPKHPLYVKSDQKLVHWAL